MSDSNDDNKGVNVCVCAYVLMCVEDIVMECAWLEEL